MFKRLFLNMLLFPVFGLFAVEGGSSGGGAPTGGDGGGNSDGNDGGSGGSGDDLGGASTLLTDPAAPPADPNAPLADGKKPEGEGDKPPMQAPEKYEAPKLPDGMELDLPMLEKFDVEAKAMNMDQATRDKFVAMYAEKMASMQEEGFAAQQAAYDKQQTDWIDACKKDPEIGGDKFDMTVQQGKRVLGTFDTNNEFAHLLSITGIGSSPATLRFMKEIAAVVSDDVLVRPTNMKTSTEKPLAQRLYPGMNP